MKRIAFSIALTLATALTARSEETVVLLHGLARTPRSMDKMERALSGEGYRVINLGYPSRKHPIEQLSRLVSEQIDHQTAASDQVHIVAHSLGGILVRHMQRHHPITNLKRVVMLSPPNQGSEVVDKIGGLKLFHWINGPAGAQLGTSDDGFVSKLGPIDFELGVITGDRSINWINSCMIPGKDDGKVSTTSARVDGTKDFKIVPATHPFIMKKKNVIRDVKLFLSSGSFAKNEAGR